MKKESPKKRENRASSCDDCLYFDYDEEIDGYVCTVNMDEDDAVSFLYKRTDSCPFYRYYDEYKSVQKQN